MQVFLGSLRDIEQEMIRERLSSAVMESLLALTIFREEFSSFFVAMFASLVFVKVLHWLVQVGLPSGGGAAKPARPFDDDMDDDVPF